MFLMSNQKNNINSYSTYTSTNPNKQKQTQYMANGLKYSVNPLTGEPYMVNDLSVSCFSCEKAKSSYCVNTSIDNINRCYECEREIVESLGPSVAHYRRPYPNYKRLGTNSVEANYGDSVKNNYRDFYKQIFGAGRMNNKF